MKYIHLSFVAVLVLTAFTSKNVFESAHVYQMSPKNSGGAPAGRSGAPGEQNCTACHTGNVNNGSSENILVVLNGVTPVSAYEPGQQYNVNLLMTSNPTKKGFQSTALDATNAMAGMFTGQAGNTSINGTTKKYANHTSTSNTSVAAPSWTWTWTAPAAGTGDVTFYVASNKANGNGNDNGDLIYLSQHVISEQGASVEEALSGIGISSFNSDSFSILNSSALKIDQIVVYNSAGMTFLNLEKDKIDFDQQNSFVHNKSFTKGIYFVQIRFGKKSTTQKVYLGND